MITQLTLSDLRGIAHGEVPDLSPLTVLVGRNGAGKSTVLEALAIGGSHQPCALVGQVVQARGGWNGASYLLRRDAPEAVVETTFRGGERRRITLRFDPQPSGLTPSELPPGHVPGPTAGPFSAIHLRAERRAAAGDGLGEDPSGTPSEGRTVFDLANNYQFTRVSGLGLDDRLELVHPPASRTHPLWRTLGDAVRAGRADDVHALLRDVLGDDFRDLYPIPESEGGSALNVHLRYGWGSVPVDVAGDGIRSLVRLALELAGRPGSVILVEEPEVHQHPGSLWQSARAVLAATARGVQVVLSTHSLELVDALVEQATPDLLAQLSVVRVALVEGELRQHRVPGDKVKVLRQQLAEDLR